MTTNDDNDAKRAAHVHMKGNVMTATRTRRTTRKAVDTDIVPEDLVLDDTPVIVADAPVVAPPVSNRKYFSHANCDHARQGEAGKKARAACRAAHRAYLAAEADHIASLSNVAV